MERLKQYLGKASFSCEADRFSALECLGEITIEIERLRSALLIAQRFCNSFSAGDCPDTVAIPINEALKVPNKSKLTLPLKAVTVERRVRREIKRRVYVGNY